MLEKEEFVINVKRHGIQNVCIQQMFAPFVKNHIGSIADWSVKEIGEIFLDLSYFNNLIK